MRSALTLVMLTCFTVYGQYEDISSAFGLDVTNPSGVYGSGASFQDFNGDGWVDISIPGEGTLKFFQNDTLGGFIPIELDLGISLSSKSYGVVWIDYDNDGDKDLFYSVFNSRVYLFKNLGNNQFEECAIQSGINTLSEYNFGLTFGDLNNDGLLDFYLARYAFNSADDISANRNMLFIQNPDHTFSNVTSLMGVGDGLQPSFIGMMWDFNEDGWQDIFVMNDRANYRNSLYLNQQGNGFIEDAASFGLDDFFDAMGIAFGDYDQDGDFDIYLTNTSNGNKLYQNNGELFYNLISTDVSTEVNSVCWGAVWSDYDNNGLDDLFTVTAPLSSVQFDHDYFFRNNGNGEFTNITDDLSIGNNEQNAYALCQSDFNKDGLEDFLISPRNSNARLYRNINENTNNWLSLGVEGTVSNLEGIGTLIKIYSGGDPVPRMRSFNCVESYISQHDEFKHVGLGIDASIDSLVIEWPLGLQEMHYNLDVNRHYNFVEGSTLVPSLNLSDSIGLCLDAGIELQVNGEYEQVNWSNGVQNNSLLIDEPGSYSATVVHESGISFQTDTVVVFSYPALAVEFNTIDPSCFGGSDGAILLSSASNDLQSIEWLNHGLGDSLQNLESGAYNYTILDEYGCVYSGFETLNQPDQIETEAVIIEDSMCPNSWEGMIIVDGENATFSYLWQLTDHEGLTIDVEESTFSCFAGGYAEWSVTDSLGCTVSGSVIVGNTQDSDITRREPMSIYPNPVTDLLKFDCGSLEINRLYYEITSIRGDQIETGWINCNETMSLSHLASGKYMIRLKTKKEMFLFPFVKI